jgi:ATP-dependent Clp protease ATP-binding subunit ClpA
MAENERLLELLEVIDLKEPSEEETLAILRETGKALEVEHSVTIAAEALEVALRASTESSHSRALPAGAIELLERACAFARLHSVRRAEQESSIEVTVREIELIAGETLPAEDTM